MSAVHYRVLYSGRVQGVGFRATTRRLATDFLISGYVKNLDNGSVELVVSGDPVEVARFLDTIDKEFGPKIRDRSILDYFWETNEPSGFSIRY